MTSAGEGPAGGAYAQDIGVLFLAVRGHDARNKPVIDRVAQRWIVGVQAPQRAVHRDGYRGAQRETFFRRSRGQGDARQTPQHLSGQDQPRRGGDKGVAGGQGPLCGLLLIFGQPGVGGERGSSVEHTTFRCLIPRRPSSLRMTRARGHMVVLLRSVILSWVGSSLLAVPMELMRGTPRPWQRWASSSLAVTVSTQSTT